MKLANSINAVRSKKIGLEKNIGGVYNTEIDTQR